jgi:hypothetical protein
MQRRPLVLILLMAGMLLVPVVPADTWAIPTLCNSIVDIATGTHCWVVCPDGDGPPLSALVPASSDATISITVRNDQNQPIVGIPASDFWLIGAANQLTLCGGMQAIDATAATDAQGQTTIADALASGACDGGLKIVVQGIVLVDPADCVTDIVVDVLTRSPDANGDGLVDSLDFNQFGNAWEPLGGTYDPCVDFDCNGAVDAIDFTAFGNHWLHECL